MVPNPLDDFCLPKRVAIFLHCSYPCPQQHVKFHIIIIYWLEKNENEKRIIKDLIKKKNQLLPTILQRRMPNVRAASLDTPTVSLPSLVVSLYHVYNNSFSFFRENTCDNIILIQFKLLSILISHLYRKRHLCTSILCKHDFLNK